MATFGERLKREREARGIDLEEVAAATKIKPRYLLALERDEFEHLPGDVFTRGFVRAYAKQVGLVPDDWVGEFERERAGRAGAASGENDQAVLREMSRLLADREDERATERRGRTVAWIVGGLVVVATAVVWLTVRVAPTREDTGADRTAQALAPASASVIEEPPAAEGESTTAEVAESERPTVSGEAREVAAAPHEDVPEEVAPASEPVPAEARLPAPEDAKTGGVTVPDHAVGTGVLHREIVGAGDRFAEGEQVWFWTRVVGGRAGETIRHVWIHEGQEITTVELKLGGPHWRTQSRKTLRPGSAGRWAVEARDADGRVLARREFVCEGP